MTVLATGDGTDGHGNIPGPTATPMHTTSTASTGGAHLTHESLPCVRRAASDRFGVRSGRGIARGCAAVVMS